MKKFVFLFAVFCFLSSCKSGGSSNDNAQNEKPKDISKVTVSIDTTVLNMAEHGIPVTFPMSSNTKIEKGTQFVQWKVFLREDAPIEVSMWDDENTLSIEEYIKADQELMQLENEFEIINEDKNGYIYKVNYDGLEDYGFFYVIIKDHRAIEFSPADLEGHLFSLDDIKEMYKYCTYTK